MKPRNIFQRKWLIGIVLLVGILVSGFMLIPRTTKEYIDAYKIEFKINSINSLYAEPKQVKINSTNNKLKGTIESISIGPEKTDVLTCFDLPDTGPWDPDAVLSVKGQKYEWTEFKLINAKDPETYTSTNRCYLITFPYTKTDEKKIKVKVSISLTQEVNHGQVNEDTGKKIKEKLQKDYPDLDFEIVTQQSGEGGGAYVVFNSKPQGMSDEEALQLISDAMTEKYPGSWDFDLEVP